MAAIAPAASSIDFERDSVEWLLDRQADIGAGASSDASGGISIVLATAGAPPALALLSTGDVLVSDGRVRVGLWATSSAVTRLGSAFSLLVPAGEVALRVEVGTHGGIDTTTSP